MPRCYYADQIGNDAVDWRWMIAKDSFVEETHSPEVESQAVDDATYVTQSDLF